MQLVINAQAVQEPNPRLTFFFRLEKNALVRTKQLENQKQPPIHQKHFVDLGNESVGLQQMDWTSSPS